MEGLFSLTYSTVLEQCQYYFCESVPHTSIHPFLRHYLSLIIQPVCTTYLHIQLHDPYDNMATRCPDCCGSHDYRNSSVGQFELDVSDMFPGSRSKWMHAGLDRDSIFCVPLSATGACSARHQHEDTNTRHVQL